MTHDEIDAINKAWRDHKIAANDAVLAFRDLCARRLPRVPGIDTVLRMAVRIEAGKSAEQAAAREYVYRWNLALIGKVWPAPHTIGM